MLKFAYKHIPNEWAASFECGSGIQLGCFSAYRALSGARADPHEGMQVNAFGENGDLQLAQDAIQAFGPFAFQNGAKLIGAGDIIRVRDDNLIFCMSERPNFGLRHTGIAFFEVDVIGFARALQRDCSVLGSAQCGCVHYDKVNGNLGRGEMLFANAFRKPIEFAWENEIRIVFNEFISIVPFVKLQAPSVSRFIRRIF